MGNNKGQSLVGVLVGIAILGILTLALTSLMTQMVKVNTTATARANLVAYSNQISGMLSSMTTASQSLVGQDITSPTAQMTDPLTGEIVIGPNYQGLGGAWTISQLSFVNTTAIPTQVNYYRTTLLALVRMDTTKTIGPNILKPILLGNVYCNITNNVIHFCYGTQDLVTQSYNACSITGGTWDPTVSLGTQCTPNTGTDNGGGNNFTNNGNH